MLVTVPNGECSNIFFRVCSIDLNEDHPESLDIGTIFFVSSGKLYFLRHNYFKVYFKIIMIHSHFMEPDVGLDILSHLQYEISVRIAQQIIKI